MLLELGRKSLGILCVTLAGLWQAARDGLQGVFLEPIYLWNEDKNTKFPTEFKDQSAALFAAIMGNGFRMSAFLQLDQLNQTGAQAHTTRELASVKSWLDDKVNESNGRIIKGGLCPMYQHFKDHSPSTLAADETLLDALRVKLGNLCITPCGLRTSGLGRSAALFSLPIVKLLASKRRLAAHPDPLAAISPGLCRGSLGIAERIWAQPNC